MGKLTRRVKYIAKERRLSIPAEFLHAHGIERGDPIVVSAVREKLYVFPAAAWERHCEMAEQVQKLFPDQEHPYLAAVRTGISLRLGSQDRIVLPRTFPFQMEQSIRMLWELEDGVLVLEPEHKAAQERPVLAEGLGQRSLLDLVGASATGAEGFDRDQAEEDLVEQISIGRIDHRDRAFADGQTTPSESLLRSLKVEGVRQPLVLRERDDGYFQVIRGFRRLIAARQLQMRKLPAIVWRGVSEEDCRRLKIMENPRSPAHENTPLQRLQSTLRLHEDQVALREIERITGRRKRTLQRYLRVAQDDALRDAIETGRLSIFKAEEILKAGVDAQVAIQEGWTVKQIRSAGSRMSRERPRRQHGPMAQE